MNCPTCKNPNQENVIECEWCGNNLAVASKNSYAESNCVLNFYLPKPKSNYGQRGVMIFIDEIMVHEFLVNDGCDFDFSLRESNPIISVSLNAGKKRHRLSNYNFDLENKKYRIDWRPNWLSLIHFDKPTIFIMNLE
jgi:hypothetical protein